MKITGMPLFSRKHWKIYALLAVAIALFIFGPQLADPHQRKVEVFLQSNTELQRSIGAIESLELVEILPADSDNNYENSGAAVRKLYRFVANGITGTRKVVVNLRVSSTGNVDSIRIESIE